MRDLENLPTSLEPMDYAAPWSEESLGREAITKLIQGIMPSEEERAGRKFGVHVIDGRSLESDIGRHIEHAVFLKHFNNDVDMLREAYSPFDRHSTFLTVIDYESEAPVGVIRLIEPNEHGNLTLKEITSDDSPWKELVGREVDIQNEIGDEPERTLDITTMAVMPDYRSNHAMDGPSAALYSTCVRWSLAHDYNIWTTIVHSNILEMMQVWGEPFVAFKNADYYMPYMGSSASMPVYTELISGLQKVRDFDEGVYKLYTESAGLQNDFVLPETL